MGERLVFVCVLAFDETKSDVQGGGKLGAASFFPDSAFRGFPLLLLPDAPRDNMEERGLLMVRVCCNWLEGSEIQACQRGREGHRERRKSSCLALELLPPHIGAKYHPLFCKQPRSRVSVCVCVRVS